MGNFIFLTKTSHTTFLTPHVNTNTDQIATMVSILIYRCVNIP
jgi:hypothetical protein